MAVSFDCSACGATIRAKSSSVGKKVRCPQCEHSQRVPGENDESGDSGGVAAWYERTGLTAKAEEARVRKRREFKSAGGQWQKVRSALGLAHGGGAALALAWVAANAALIGVILWYVQGSIRDYFREESGPAFIPVVIILALLVASTMWYLASRRPDLVPFGIGGWALAGLIAIAPLFAPGAALVVIGILLLASAVAAAGAACVVAAGCFRCASAPADSELRGLAVASGSLLLGEVASGAAALWMAGSTGDLRAMAGVRGLLPLLGTAGVLAVLAHLVSGLFLRRLALLFDDRPTAGHVAGYLTYLGVAAVAAALLGLAAATGAARGTAAASCCLALAVLGLIGSVWWLDCVSAARDLVRKSKLR